MTRRRRLLVWGGALLVATPIALLAVLLVVANTDPGRRAAEHLMVLLSGGRVVVGGLAGNFPGDLRVARVELRDAQGPWLVATDITLRASPARLLLRHLQVEQLRAGYVGLARRPVTAERGPGASDSRTFLQRFDVDRVEIARLEIGAALAGADAVLELQGELHVGGAEEARAALSARRLDGPGIY